LAGDKKIRYRRRYSKIYISENNEKKGRFLFLI